MASVQAAVGHEAFPSTQLESSQEDMDTFTEPDTLAIEHAA